MVSEPFLDLGYTSPEDAIRYRAQRAADKKPLTSSQKNHRVRRIEEQHEHQKRNGIMEPSAQQLAAMTPSEKADHIANYRRLRAALESGQASIEESVIVEPVEIVQPELFDSLE